MITSIPELEKKFEQYRAERFPTEAKWMTGNCYQFACILRDWLFNHNVLSLLVYDVIDGHFLVVSELPLNETPSEDGSDVTLYSFLLDYTGVTLLFPGFYMSLGDVFYNDGKHHLVEWESYVTVDPLHWHRIRRDCCL